MSDKQTYCPSCLTTYKVTVAQLTVAQGMVCCPKCDTSFNALTHLVTENKEAVFSVTPTTAESINPSLESTPLTVATQVSAPLYSHALLQIFDQKVENSNIDLKTYLNNLNYFSTEPIGTLPAVNWSEHEAEKKHGVIYYAAWTTFNLVLVGTLVFQFFWFNPHYLQNSPVMGRAFNSVCEVFSCSNLQEHYNLISTKKVKAKRANKNQTQFTGELINYHDRSLAVPTLRVHLKQDGLIIATYNLQPKEYLVKNLHGIERIPTNSPFRFDFTLPIDRKDFDNYDFEIIRP